MSNVCSYAGPVLVAVLIALSEMTGFAPDTVRPLGMACMAVYLPLLAFQTARFGSSAIDKGFGAYFVVFSAAVWLPLGGLERFVAGYAVALVYVVLFFATAVPLAMGLRPFTEFFARKRTDPALWQTDVFRAINRRMTAVWSFLLALSVVSAAAPHALGLAGPAARMTLEGVLPTALMVLVGRRFNKWYPQHYQRKIGLV